MRRTGLLGVLCALALAFSLSACTREAPTPVQTTPLPEDAPRVLTQEELDRINEAFSPQV